MNLTVLGYKTILLKTIRRKSELRHKGVKGMKWGIRNGPPYPIRKNQNGTFLNQVIDKNKKAGIIKTIYGSKDPPKQGKPNSIIKQIKDGSLDKICFYDDYGWRSFDVHFTDHGKPKQHPFGKNGEHFTIYNWDKENNKLLYKEDKSIPNYCWTKLRGIYDRKEITRNN